MTDVNGDHHRQKRSSSSLTTSQTRSKAPKEGDCSKLDSFGGVLLIACLILGPLLAGSYFGEWRWPLILASSTAAAILFLSSLIQKKNNWWLLSLLIWPLIQGLWMWYNAWGEFSTGPIDDIIRLPWHLSEIDNQPMPALPGAADRHEAMDKLAYIIPCLGLIWGTRHLVISRPSWCHAIANAIFWTGAIVALLGLIQRGTGAEGIFWIKKLRFEDHSLFFGTYRSPGIATCYLNVALAFGLSSILTTIRASGSSGTEKNNRKLLLLLATTTAVILIICSVIVAGSKAGMVFGIITIALWATMNRRSIIAAFHKSSDLFLGDKRAERNIVIVTLLCILGLSLLSFAGIMSDRWQAAHEGGYPTLTGRMQSNQVCLKMTADEGWGALGWGPGSFYPMFPFYSGEYGDELSGTYVYAHNDYLQTLVEWGWLGSLCFAAIIGGGFLLVAREVFFHRTHHSKTRFLYFRGYLLGILSLLLHASVDFPFQIESLAVTFAIMVGVTWAIVDIRGQDIRKRSRSESSHPSNSC